MFTLVFDLLSLSPATPDDGYDDSVAMLASYQEPRVPMPHWDPVARARVTPEPGDPFEVSKAFADAVVALMESPPDIVVHNSDSGTACARFFFCVCVGSDSA